MNDLNLETSSLISKLNTTDMKVIHEASKIFNRVFDASSIIKRLKKSISFTTIYTSIHKLDELGIFMIYRGKEINRNDRVITLTLTAKGRSICKEIKEIIEETNQTAILI